MRAMKIWPLVYDPTQELQLGTKSGRRITTAQRIQFGIRWKIFLTEISILKDDPIIRELCLITEAGSHYGGSSVVNSPHLNIVPL